MPAGWVLKSEPDSFSIDNLLASKDQSTLWDGVRNYAARNNLMAMKPGDSGYFYHSSCPVPAIVGELRVSAAAIPDETAFDPESPYFDPKSKRENPRWFSPQLRGIRKYSEPLTREMLAAAGLQNSLIFKSFRLSVIPLTGNEVKMIEKLLKSGKRN